ncbi:hypothetical protein [Mucilaginibacter panaciglaebae]|uniref:Uncharacterized protein n=1 Tax=Mucilaginibacter panaciglaebae TaxID=502331 RepID=A0ABP7WXH0_9SPHI
MEQDQQKTPQQAQSNILPVDEIIAGAYSQNQLDKIEKNVKVGEQRADETPQGTSSGDGINTNAADRAEQQTSDNNAGEELGGITNLSLDKLKKEGDNDN